MVRRTNSVFLPHIEKHIATKYTRGIKGLGIGAVLLTGKNGGAGSASSYASLDDYINTTNLNPYTQEKIGGQGLSSVSKRIGNLSIKTSNARKPKNISFEL